MQEGSSPVHSQSCLYRSTFIDSWGAACGLREPASSRSMKVPQVLLRISRELSSVWKSIASGTVTHSRLSHTLTRSLPTRLTIEGVRCSHHPSVTSCRSRQHCSGIAVFLPAS
ncbi:unnamed protein product [Nezara viridula]|uniref:Uncharacterized protein n=1 Tax=Nezara viridula TaxID=85310 RepID=A0A9P0HIA0_NEZVI|nr:unnamed protein product [Nezara viridula]